MAFSSSKQCQNRLIPVGLHDRCLGSPRGLHGYSQYGIARADIPSLRVNPVLFLLDSVIFKSFIGYG